MRKYSKTYKKIISIRLNANNQIGIYIPNGFAHGFQTQKKNTIVIYFHSAFYKKDLEKNLNPFDPKINIKWPLKVSNISKKDLNS
jgi:dTDP-4-dehydrorhamnose 3,5-epimerase